jgi:hypothetical protein
MELFSASNQWATRPDDERFGSLEELLEACRTIEASTGERPIRLQNCEVTALPDDPHAVALVGQQGRHARFTHWSFGQLCSTVKAPASYLRTLPPSMVVANLNHGLRSLGDGISERRALFNMGDNITMRGLVSEKYTRIWDSQIAERMLGLRDNGWRVPPARPAREGQKGTRPATEADVLNDQFGMLSIRVGDLIAPAGLYKSAHDLFIFMINEDKRIDDGSEQGLSRGFFLWNSEVGAKSFGIMEFLLQHVCGNHIVWGASNVRKLTVRHVGSADDKAFRKIRMELTEYADSSANETEANIKRAKTIELGKSKDEVIDAIFKRRINGLSRKLLGAAYDTCEKRTDDFGAPTTLWGMASGITVEAQNTPHADERNVIDVAAGKLLDAAF